MKTKCNYEYDQSACMFICGTCKNEIVAHSQSDFNRKKRQKKCRKPQTSVENLGKSDGPKGN
jgi:hypothetical protein